MIYKGIDLIDNKNIDTINSMINNKLHNDHLFENTFLVIKFDLENTQDGIDFIYRLLWEGIYLRRNNNNRSCINSMVVFIVTSIAEALDYIRQITPPIFRDKTMNTLKTVDDIKSMVDFYLADTKASDYKYRIDLFKKCLQFNEFDTIWDYNNERIDMIYKYYFHHDYKLENYIIGVIDYSEYPITSLKTLNEDISDTNIQMTLCVKNVNKDIFGIIDLFKFLNRSNIILNVKHINDDLYVSIYDNKLYSKWHNWFYIWYNKYK